MKYLKYTFVDAATQRPITEEPARRGVQDPSGITNILSIESTYHTGIPTLYGISDDSYTLPYWLGNNSEYGEISEEQFFSEIKIELLSRTREKRKYIEKNGFYFNGHYIRTSIESQNRIGNTVGIININPNIENVDFEYLPDQWVVLSREDILSIGRMVGLHVQECFSWGKLMCDEISSIDSIEKLISVRNMIASWNGTSINNM